MRTLGGRRYAKLAESDVYIAKLLLFDVDVV